MDFDRGDPVLDALTEIDLDPSLTREAKIAALLARADEAPPGSEMRTVMRGAAADHLQVLGQFDEARALLQQIGPEDEPGAIHPAARLLDLELAAGNPDEVAELSRTLLAASRNGDLTEQDHHFVGESLEEHGRERDALRWFSIPLRMVDPDDLWALPIGCVHGRYRVRRVLGMPFDGYDRASEEIKEIVAQERGEDW